MRFPEVASAPEPASCGALTAGMSASWCSAAHGALSWTVVSDPAEAEGLRPNGARCWAQARHELTVSPEWLLTWWRVFGGLQGRQLRLGLCHDAGRLIGLAPLLCRRYWWAGVLPFRRLEFLGSGEPEKHGIYSNHLSVLAERGAEECVATDLARALVEGVFGPWDDVLLPMMSGDTPLPQLLVDAFRAAGLSAEMTETARAPYIALPKSWEDYLESLSANGRRNIRRSLKAFDAWSGGTTRLCTIGDANDLGKAKQVLINLHRALEQ